jgi:hypothetical protein
LTIKSKIALLFYALTVSLAVPTVAAAQSDNNSTNTASNGSSTGVGNAGSFGIGSGTANGNATATATSNGVSDSNNTTSNRISNFNITAGTVALSNSSLSQTVSGIPASQGYNLPNSWSTGNIAPASISNFNGIVTDGENTGVSSNVGVQISITPGTVQTNLSH